MTIRMSSVVSSSYATSPQVSADQQGPHRPGARSQSRQATVNAPKIRLFSFWCQGGSGAAPTESEWRVCALARRGAPLKGMISTRRVGEVRTAGHRVGDPQKRNGRDARSRPSKSSPPLPCDRLVRTWYYQVGAQCATSGFPSREGHAHRHAEELPFTLLGSQPSPHITHSAGKRCRPHWGGDSSRPSILDSSIQDRAEPRGQPVDSLEQLTVDPGLLRGLALPVQLVDDMEAGEQRQS